jgi:uncharacterized protein involved in exopolysaccharide biosynthesis
MALNGNESESRQISAREILMVIFRRKVPILIVALIVTAIALTAASRTSSVYEGTAKVLVRRMGATPLVTTWTPFFGLEEEMNTEVEIITSTAVMESAVEILKDRGVYVKYEVGDSILLAEPTIADVAAGISATPVEMSNVILVRYTGSDPEFVTATANAAAEAYIEHRVPVRSSSGIQEYFDEQLAIVEARLLDLISTELALRKEGGVYDLEWQYHTTITRQSELELQLAEVRSRRMAEEEKLRLVKERIALDPELLVPFSEFSRDRLGGQMMSEYWNLRKERDEKAALLTDANPRVKMLDERIAKMEDRFREEIDRRIVDREFLVEDLKAEEAGFETSIGRINQELRNTPEVVAQINHLQQEIRYTYAHYEKLLDKMLDSMASEADDIRLSNAKIISMASAHLSTAGQMQTVYVFFSILLGISLGIGFGFLLENMDHSVRSVSDIEDTLGIPLLGSVPESRGMPQMTRRVDRTFGKKS